MLVCNINLGSEGLEFEKFNNSKPEIKELYIDVVTDTDSMVYNNSTRLLDRSEAAIRFSRLCRPGTFGYYAARVNHKYIGYISLYRGDTEDVVSFAMFVSPKERRKGYGYKLVKSIIDFYKAKAKELGIKRIEAIATVENIPSNKIMKKVGMKLVKKDFFARGRFCNKYIMDI